MGMAKVQLDSDTLTIHVEGLDKVLALRSRLAIPLTHVLGAEANPEVARRWFKGVKWPGTNLPGLVTAGTFFQPGDGELAGWTFWDVHAPERAIVITLAHEHYQRLVIGVDEPDAVVAAINGAVQGRSAR
jgi:hypothetical protein